ncbi:hypothetical protein BP5796_02039 [Coleophoma crateriformis]|uniref:Major facilitator superfamily (MFS) profile domain-containing protein n=1 Tax=Coleophoma crateriformis TaxID=565419 RepID=A0A3D8T247_9HELO|nr:hypothetical protein BP5796_02039 [Coleophoma crateriformis]
MEKDLEQSTPSRISHWQLIIDQARVTPDVLAHRYEGAGTHESPYIVTWIPNDAGNPMGWSTPRKWALSSVGAVSMLATAFSSSAYSAPIQEVLVGFNIDTEVATLGVSLFVLGFAVGPLMWAPLSELYGRQLITLISFGAFTVFNAGAAGAQNIQTLLVLRFLAGSFGSSPFTNAGGQVADMFTASERGLAMGFFALAPFLGPCLGPIAGGFLGEAEGWRWVIGLMAIFSGIMWMISMACVPETYAPVLLRKRAQKLSKVTGKVYLTKADMGAKIHPFTTFKIALMRPWILLFKEPIVLLLSIYMAIIYGTLYMLFAAFPIVFQEYRGWSEGIGGLAFLGVLVGMVISTMTTPIANARYNRVAAQHNGFAPPETRLVTAMIGAIAIPIGLFWFAWTNSPSIHWISCIAAGAPFGFGMVMVFLAITNYLIDSYTIFAASALAANAVLRSLLGFAFPLFTTYMFENLGIHWASSIPAFLSLACVPFPFLFYKYGAAIRAKCVYAAQSEAVMRSMMNQHQTPAAEADHDETMDQETSDSASTTDAGDIKLEKIKTAKSAAGSALTRALSIVEAADYNESPYDIDQVNTLETPSGLATTKSRG